MKILFAGGGTAGHINPAIAIAKYAVSADKNTKVLFIGKAGGMESKLVPKEGFPIEFINVESFKRKLSTDNIATALKMCSSFKKCTDIIKSFKPDVIVGTGGYVCVPPVLAGAMRGIPTLIHEQNAFPGSAIKLLSKICTVTAISFEESRSYLASAKNIVYTGNPVRPGILSVDYATARSRLGIGKEKFVAVMGGSLGAVKINDVVCSLIPKINGTNIKLCWATGEREYNRVVKKLKDESITLGDNIILKPYIHNMDLVMNGADLVISRSGAITLSEICTLGKPSVLIPSPNVTNNHQFYNAHALEKNKAAVMIQEKDFNEAVLYKTIMNILADEALCAAMSENAKKLGSFNATELIYREIRKMQN